MEGVLGRRDPEGYYVVPVRRGLVDRVLEGVRGVDVVFVGDVALVRTKSRSLASKILRRAVRLGALAGDV